MFKLPFVNKLQYSIIILLFTFLFSCKKNENNWESNFDGIVSSSSPQCADLTGDGIKDIIIGAGADEWEKTDAGILAINGKTGQLIWKAKARNQIVGSAVFLDVNKDNTPDIIIGGRSAELQALDGKTGKLIWEFYTKQGRFISSDDGWYNFFNPQIVLDQNNDGTKDILICNGGDALLAPGTYGRKAGNLLLLSGLTGKILAQDTMPDGAETYSTPVCFDCDTNPNPSFIFGSGGETQGGHLYLADLNMLKIKQLIKSKILLSSANKGFISPPILAYFNKDSDLDILVNQADGQTTLIDGKTKLPIWIALCDSAEVYSQPAIGNFLNNDDIPDVFVSYSYGQYPTYTKSINHLIDGKTGKIVQKSELKRFTYSSPLVVDIDNDKIDEVLLNTCRYFEKNKFEEPFYELTHYNFTKKTEETFGQKQYGACFASTPWLGDLDNNGKLDLIYSGSPAFSSEFPGSTAFQKPNKSLKINKIEFENHLSKSVKWGNYLGNKCQSIGPNL
jgi:outer membrane protein assembly factor BamB